MQVDDRCQEEKQGKGNVADDGKKIKVKAMSAFLVISVKSQGRFLLPVWFFFLGGGQTAVEELVWTLWWDCSQAFLWCQGTRLVLRTWICRGS